MYVQPLPLQSLLSLLFYLFPSSKSCAIIEHLSEKHLFESKLDIDHNFDSIKGNLRLVLLRKEKYLV